MTVGLGDYSVPWFGIDATVSVLTFILFSFLGLTAFAELRELRTASRPLLCPFSAPLPSRSARPSACSFAYI
jgi:hypothetical protein